MTTRIRDIIQRDTRANQPAATAVDVGTLYYVTDENVTERSNGATWEDCTDAGVAGLHATSHENGGSDEIDVTGLSGVLADPQTSSTDLLTDWDNTGISDGDVPTWDNGSSKWKPQAPTGGGGSTLSYLGYNTIGGSSEVVTNRRVYMKKITVASNGVLLNVAAHVKNDTGDHVQAVNVAVFSDSAGSPLRVLAQSSNPASSILLESAVTTPVYRWLTTPINLEVSAGDYWIAVQMNHPTNAGSIAYDGSGTDRYYTSGGDWFADAGFYSVTTGILAYSIRAAFLPTT